MLGRDPVNCVNNIFSVITTVKGVVIISICQRTINIHKFYQKISDEAIKMHNDKKSWKEIARHFHVDKDSLVNYLDANGMYQKSNRNKKLAYSNELLVRASDMYQNNNKSISKIAIELNVNRKTLSKYLKKYYNINVLHDGKKKVDDRYFCNIDTKEKAYWLGFLYADGYVSENGTVEFCLQDRDKQSVIDFRKALKSNHSITRKTTVLNEKEFTSWKISIKSPIMAKGLVDNGCIPNKTYKMLFPKEIDASLISHFLRGYTDGDGCIYIGANKLFLTYTSASYEFLKEYQSFLDKIKIVSHIYKVKNKNNWKLDISASYAQKLCDFIYVDSSENTRLKRKYDKYIYYLQIAV